MTDEAYSRRRAEVEAWGNAQIERIAGAPPVSSCPKVEELLHAAVAAQANRAKHASAIEAVEIIVERLLECIDQDYYGMERLDPQTGDDRLDAQVREEIERWEQLWRGTSPSGSHPGV
jgi:hypothetical protein